MTPLTVFELRNYVMHPGRRDVLIDMFERNFIESQGALGSQVVATFRNLDDPDRFVWIRGFESMETRARALDGFYSGPLWQSLRSEAVFAQADLDLMYADERLANPAEPTPTALALAGVYLAYHWEQGRLTIAGRTKGKP